MVRERERDRQTDRQIEGQATNKRRTKGATKFCNLPSFERPARASFFAFIAKYRESERAISPSLTLGDYKYSPSLGKSIRVRLRGEGVRPVLTMLPADGRLDMGHVLEGDTVERWVLCVSVGVGKRQNVLSCGI